MLRPSLPFLATVLAAAGCIVQGCGDEASSSVGATAGDAGPAPSDASSRPASPCSAGGPRYAALSTGASGGELSGFADCLDAGAIPPVATEGECTLLYARGLFEVERVARSYLEHGSVKATQGAGLAVELPSADVRMGFAASVVGGEPVRFVFGESAAHDSAEIEVVAPAAVAFTVAPGASRATGLDVTWQGGKAGEAVSLVLRGEVDGDGRVLRCGADAAKGRIIVAPALLATWPSGTFPLEVTSSASRADAAKRTSASVRVRAAATGASTVTL